MRNIYLIVIYFLVLLMGVLLFGNLKGCNKIAEKELHEVVEKMYHPDTLSITNVVKTDTNFILPEGWIFKKVQYYADSMKVPVKLIYEIGMNESGWQFPNDSNYLQPPTYVSNETSYGDLQMITKTWNYWKKKLNLEKRNRENSLIASIAYLKWQYIRNDSSWKKARFAYGRGSWRHDSTWTSLERRFMAKIDFSHYQ